MAKSISWRWQTANQYTQMSALYPFHFGLAIAFAHQVVKRFPVEETWRGQVKQFVRNLLPDIPPMEVVLREVEARKGQKKERPFFVSSSC